MADKLQERVPLKVKCSQSSEPKNNRGCVRKLAIRSICIQLVPKMSVRWRLRNLINNADLRLRDSPYIFIGLTQPQIIYLLNAI